jgi:hypothetical protein
VRRATYRGIGFCATVLVGKGAKGVYKCRLVRWKMSFARFCVKSSSARRMCMISSASSQMTTTTTGVSPLLHVLPLY